MAPSSRLLEDFEAQRGYDEHVEEPLETNKVRFFGMMGFFGFLLVTSFVKSMPASNRGIDAAEPTDFFDNFFEEPVIWVEGQKYTSVQYLGFNLFTAPGTEADGCLNVGENIDACYLGSPEVLNDTQHRLSIFTQAIDRAYASEYWDRNPETLKIFLAPEFYWRGQKGAYRIGPSLNLASEIAVKSLSGKLRHQRFKHWIVVPGTVVMVQHADQSYVEMSHRPYENISYYNFAPIHIGGTDLMYLKFKNFISSIDFLQITPGVSRQVQAPPGRAHEFCKKHPDSNGCIYHRLPRHLLDQMGWQDFQILRGGILNIGGVRVGFEICLDHAMGQLCNNDLKPDETVDVQTIVSAGMNVASGPVCTKPGGPTFLADGFSRTELSLNRFGQGRRSTMTEAKRRRYNVGLTYGADAMVSMQQWVADTIYDLTGTGFGTREAGMGTLPGGSESAGSTGIVFKQIAALGEAESYGFDMGMGIKIHHGRGCQGMK
ncbi:unnamed protein product [Cladocopium goreaui]|uniref:Glyceraldehyde-3-phosphate dehydrogenase, chloroplastic n=1 Tax=Cladocopium goreaui TaxID=2562237 RepID=A0A9P1D608_9DINO|nr:unnamed protein product [Cladocopium goreaui]